MEARLHGGRCSTPTGFEGVSSENGDNCDSVKQSGGDDNDEDEERGGEDTEDGTSSSLEGKKGVGEGEE